MSDRVLSPDQFYPMHELLGMHSYDAGYYQDQAKAYGQPLHKQVRGNTVADVLPISNHEIDADLADRGSYHHELYNAMSRAGHQRWNNEENPVEVGHDPQHGLTLEDGHHRVAIAQRLGWPGLRGYSTDTALDNAASEYWAKR